MFEPGVVIPTDQDMLDLLAQDAMGWTLHGTSAHRPGSRNVPHAWKHRQTRRVYVFVGGSDRQKQNVPFDPLNDANAAAELHKRATAKGAVLENQDLTTPAGRRNLCALAHAHFQAQREAAAAAKAAAAPPADGHHEN